MNKGTKIKIPTVYLPDGWEELGAKQFELSTSTIRKVVKGDRTNAEVFDFMLDLALKGKAAADEKLALLNTLNA
jgi:hypothetical protein